MDLQGMTNRDLRNAGLKGDKYRREQHYEDYEKRVHRKREESNQARLHLSYLLAHLISVRACC